MDAKYVLESVFQAVLGGTIQMLLERIASSDVVNYLLGKKDSDFQSLVKKLEIMMSSLTGVLNDAEQRQIRDDPRVEAWLDEVQEAVFDAEDFLGEIEYEALRLKVTGDSGAGTSEVRQSKRPKIFSFSRNSEDRDLENGIRIILDRLEEIVKQKKVLGLKETLSEKKQWQRPPSTCLVEESHVFGRDGDKEAVIKLLLPDDISGNEKISVIPIVGVGGVGKTTLAQTVFNHSRVKQNFDLMLWVCVSENYDVHRTTSALLSSSSHDACDLNSLQVRLRDKLAGKKFLIVLDDVWNEKTEDWEVMRMPFNDGAQGSKIVVTTRSHVVARIAGTVPTYHLDELTPEDSWELFAKHAFGDDIDTELEKVGREIVKKCKGLPLALKTLGGLLHSESDIEHWKGILESEIWNQMVSQSDILPALRLSYHYLPSHLKRCFAYCAVLPKDYVIEKEKLVLFWMAQNLLERPKGSMRIEEVGDQYFNVLLSMSFFQPSSESTPNKPTFVMHDLMVDLATYVSRKYCFRLEDKICDDIGTKETVRHLAYFESKYLICEKFNSIFKATHVRTLMPIEIPTQSPCSVSKREIHGFFSKAKKLRVLYFTWQHQLCGVPIDSICKLRHLRMLNLYSLDIQHLPNSLCTLYNLQTLELVFCESLSTLPHDFHRLINLRYLCAIGCGFEVLPESLSLLSNLQKLVLRGCLKLNKWPNNFHNLISLRYLDVAYSIELEELPESLSLLTNLQTLELQGCMKVKKLPIEFERLVNLRYLDVSQSGLEELPESPSLLSNLKTLKSQGCMKLIMLPREFHHRINLRDLKVCSTLRSSLTLCRLLNLGVWNLCHGSEPEKLFHNFYLLTNLRPLNLSFYDMRNWKEWLVPDGDDVTFPKLRRQTLKKCNRLEGDLHRFFSTPTCLTFPTCENLRYLQALAPKPPTALNTRLFSDLRSLALVDCQELKFLPENMHELLPVLGFLDITDCAELESFPTSGLPLSLHSLLIRNCDKLVASRSNWNLETLHNLTSFSIERYQNEDMESFPEQGLLPTTLTQLSISSIKSLTSLNNEELQRLTSLKRLSISYCPNLQTMTGEALPSSLEYLNIMSCPLLKENCERATGEYWDHIAHIPEIIIRSSVFF